MIIKKGFMAHAKLAAEFEHKHQYLEAKNMWHIVYGLARNVDNIAWAYARMIFCEQQLRRR